MKRDSVVNLVVVAVVVVVAVAIVVARVQEYLLVFTVVSFYAPRLVSTRNPARLSRPYIDRRENARDLSLSLSVSLLDAVTCSLLHRAAMDIPTERIARRFHNG